MADYINRDKVLVELECGVRAGNYEEGYEKYMHINSIDDCIDTVKYFDTADVVEWSEYVESQKEVMRLRVLSHKVNQDAVHYEEMYRELHRKINKAIEEITKLRDSTSRMITDDVDFVNECYEQYVNCFDECLRIIKRSIGELQESEDGE